MIDRRTCEVVTEAGERVPYDRLLIATGSNPIMLPLPGKDLPGVIGFRDIYDVDRMVEASTSHRNAVVIGGGLLGLEAANGLMKRGMNVTVVHLLDTLMERQLDPVAGGHAAQVAGRARHGVQDAGADPGDPRRGSRHRRALRRRRRACRPISS